MNISEGSIYVQSWCNTFWGYSTPFNIPFIHSYAVLFKYPPHYNTCITKDFTPKSAIFSIWGQSSTTWATFYPILTTYPLELTIVHILDNTYPLLKWPSVEFSVLNTYRVSHIETCFLNWLWGVEGSIICWIIVPSVFKRFGNLSFLH